MVVLSRFPVSWCQLLLILFSISLSVSSAQGGYGDYSPKPKQVEPGLDHSPPTFITVQGVIYCDSGSKFVPIKGAKARISCLGVNKDGYETAPFSALSRPSDVNGYFMAEMYSQLEDECKAFLHSSPLKNCQFPSDVNKGLNGAPLISYHPLGDRMTRLYSVGPFVYTSEPKPTPPMGY